MSLTSWFLVSSGGTRHRLPREMIFVGRDDCELMLQSRSVDKQHAVINYDASADEHLVKDLGSLNGTFVNDVRIPEQTYIILKLDDKLRFGYDTNLFTVVRGELRVPEEALKHEKFTSQLQLSQKSSEVDGAKLSGKTAEPRVQDSTVEIHHKAIDALKSEEKSADLSGVPRGTPLYGQPSWWGDDETEEQNGCRQDGKPEEKAQEIVVLGNKHDDGTQSDSENVGAHKLYSKRAALEDHLKHHYTEQKKLHSKALNVEKHSDQPVLSQTAFMIEFFDEGHPRKRRSYSFSQNIGGLCPETPSPASLARTEKVKPPPPLAQNNSTQHRAVHAKLLKQKSEEPSAALPFLQSALLRSSGSLGHRPSPNEDMEKKLKTQLVSVNLEKDDDDQSDKGTYTIELENPNTEEMEARKMIDKVFGVDDSQDYNRPVINESQKDLVKDWAINSATIVLEEKRLLSTTGFLDTEESTGTSGSKRWVSQWASLAANHTKHEENEVRMESSALVHLENDTDINESGLSIRSSGSITSLTSLDRKRRTLPQLPKEEIAVIEGQKTKVTAHLRSEIGEKQDTELQEKETPTHSQKEIGHATDKSLTKVSRTINGLSPKTDKMVFHSSSCLSSEKDKNENGKETSMVKQSLAKIQQEQNELTHWVPAKLSSARTASQVEKGKEESSVSHKLDMKEKALGRGAGKTEVKVAQSEGKRRKAEEAKLQPTKGLSGDKKETSKPLVRQGSFTIDKPSANIPIELIPHINKQGTTPSISLISTNRANEKSDSVETDPSLDTTLILKDTEAVMAFLEAKLREENKTDEGPDTPSYNRDNSISPESDVDTASTISLVTGDSERKTTQKRKSFTTLYKDRCSTSSPSKDILKSSCSNASDKMEKKTKSRSSEASSRGDARKIAQSTGRIRQPSVDLTDDDQTSSVPHSAISDILSSDQETCSGKSHGRTPFTSADEHLHSKTEGIKLAKLKSSSPSTGQVSKSTTLPRPRPTRTSLLRRARLGEVSDSELADADKASVASEVSTTSSTSKPPSGRRNISRIDLLAQPRRNRLGSLSARSDSEATMTRSSTSRTSDTIIRSGIRLTPPADSTKVSPRIRANSISRLSDSKSKSLSSTHNSPSVNSRWRRFPTDYASTSEDEFGSNRNSPKHARLRTSPALKTTRVQNIGTPVQSSNAMKHRIKEQEDYIRDWTAHREEIARISQDLALIAREINDVAGEIDSVTSSGTAPSTTVSTAATTPGSAIDTREEVGDLHGEMHKLVDRVFDESLNFRKIPPVVNAKTPDGNIRPNDPKPQTTDVPEPPTITRRRTWSRDEVMGDTLLLSSVFQFSRKIRQSIDKTAGKIRILFKDKDRNWEDIEKKLRAESDIPIVKTSSMEISSILQELKRVEKQLQVINSMIDPDGTLDALSNLGFAGPVQAAHPRQKSTPGSQSAHPQIHPNCLPEARAVRPATASTSRELGTVESEHDFSIHFNRFNPDGEEEDPTLCK
ncbi:PREDICTED: centrosomal protein of 170 kDa isoform X6 [Thamnophis sirtalis]|uniref:Centrosomal protein of 170 kDa n=1 Tax=Thamnophis sirtalis TaxID=35019 RepID=A0A6I9XE38_9SAUR|nr:PREDICTED: centrosomal protein of 170 kDa isoform X6 [Thamnophis sirtalis]